MILAIMKGVMIGFAAAALIGPIAILCIRRTLLEGQLAGLAIGFGVAIADGMYALLAGLGLTVIFDFLHTHTTTIQFLGSLFLIFLGIKTYLEQPQSPITTIQGTNFMRIACNTFLLTLTNPLTILTFMWAFAFFNVEPESYFAAIMIACTVTIGSLLWWVLLTSFLCIFHTKVTIASLNIFNKISGGFIALIGAFGIISLFTKFRLG